MDAKRSTSVTARYFILNRRCWKSTEIRETYCLALEMCNEEKIFVFELSIRPISHHLSIHKSLLTFRWTAVKTQLFFNAWKTLRSESNCSSIWNRNFIGKSVFPMRKIESFVSSHSLIRRVNEKWKFLNVFSIIQSNLTYSAIVKF